jgi:hypothetical protein
MFKFRSVKKSLTRFWEPNKEAMKGTDLESARHPQSRPAV